MNSFKPLKKQISITLDSDMLKELRKRADFCERSLSQYVNIILREYLREEKMQPLKSKVESL